MATQPPFKKKKRTDVDGDWRRATLEQNLQYKVTTVRWTYVPTMKMFSFPTPVPVGMERFLMKLENVQNRTYLVVPIAVREEFSMTNATYRSEDCTINVLFSEPKIDNLRLLYCRICTTKQNLKKRFWDRYPEKLPKDGICREELTRNWDNLDLS